MKKERAMPPVVAIMVTLRPRRSETIPKRKLPAALMTPMTPKAPLASTGSIPILIMWGTTNVSIEIMPPIAKKYEMVTSLNDLVAMASLGSHSTSGAFDSSSPWRSSGSSPSTCSPMDSGSSRRKM